MKESHHEDCYNQPKEQLVVGVPNTVVKPSAVVVEVVYAPVARAAVLCAILNICFTNLAIVFVSASIKPFSFFCQFSLLQNDRVSWVYYSGFPSKEDYCQEQ